MLQEILLRPFVSMLTQQEFSTHPTEKRMKKPQFHHDRVPNGDEYDSEGQRPESLVNRISNGPQRGEINFDSNPRENP
ncbi:hypothetical protein FBQ85_00810 [Cytophagia bacterium CHB2]|nr:hypothetical protein [Cytophagia bacterium CHB2]